ncbi:MAG TPA: tetratricopeptide repeat protein [Acidobacteriaceae bacterium]
MKGCLKAFFLTLLLALLKPGFGQQSEAANYPSLIAAAQEATARNDYVAAADAYRKAVRIHPETPELWANLGLMEHEAGRYSDAIQSFQHAYRLKPSLYVPNLFLGMDYLQTGKAEAAIPFLSRAERMNSTDPQAPLNLGHAYAAQENFPAAAREFTRVTRLDPKRSSAWFDRGMAYLDQVEVSARRMSTEGKDSSYAKALYAESMVRQARYHEATDSYQSAIALKPQPPCLRAELGFLSLKQQDRAAAATEFERANESDSNCPLTALGEARLQVESGDNSAALSKLQKIWRSDPGYLRSSAPEFADGLSKDQSAAFRAFIADERAEGKVDPEFEQTMSAVLDGLAVALATAPQTTSPGATLPREAAKQPAQQSYAAGRLQRCAQELQRNLAGRSESELLLLATCSYFNGDYAITSDASSALAHRSPHSLAALYWSIKANERLALQSLDQFARMEPDSSRTHILLGDMYRQRQRFSNAQGEYEQALVLTPGDRAALLGLSYANFGNGNLDAALATAKQALLQNPDDPELNLLIAEILFARHDFSAAESFLQKSLTAKPQMLPHVHALLGRVYAETGRTEEAIEQLKMGVSDDQDGTTYYQLARLYRKIGDEKNAAAAMQQMRLIQQHRRSTAALALEDSARPEEESPQ